MDLIEVKEKSSDSLYRHPWELARAEVVSKIIKRNINITSGDTILDIGCGDIFFIEKLAENYPEAFFIAVDIAFDDTMIVKYKENSKITNLKLFKTLEEAFEKTKVSIDLILLLDVIEHIEDDISFLKNFYSYSYITDETKIIITVPAFQDLFCSHDIFLGHYRRYTNKTLIRNTRQAGFKNIEAGYFFSLLLLPRLIEALKEKVLPGKNKTTGLVEWNRGKFITTVFKNVLLLDYKFSRLFSKTGIRLVGLSNYLVCQKSA